tara:strand:+ start:16 stop:321 length:306 start_codon:yes stop_codon:yes gene_type:complete
MYNIRGKIIDVKSENITLKNGDQAEKMLITIIDDTKFDNKYQFEIFGKVSIDISRKNIKLDKYARIEFYIKCNQWKDKFFTTLVIKDIIVEDNIDINNPPF